MTLRERGAITGIGETAYSRNSGESVVALQMRASLATDRAQFYRELAFPFYGANRPGAKVSQGILDQFFLWSMQSGLKSSYDTVTALSKTEFHNDLKKFDVPTLLIHGEDDQIVPINISSRRSANRSRFSRVW